MNGPSMMGATGRSGKPSRSADIGALEDASSRGLYANELDLKAVAHRLGKAMAMAVASRFWLGGGVRMRRALTLVRTIDGLASHVTAFARVFREPVGGVGRGL